MTTPQQALDIMRDRELTVGPAPRGGWLTRLPNGNRVRVPAQPTPADALEAAEAHLADREEAQEERRARRLIQAMQRGTHYHVPRTVTEPDPETGEPAGRTVFDILRADGEATPITGRNSVAQAWLDLAAAVRAARGGGA